MHSYVTVTQTINQETVPHRFFFFTEGMGRAQLVNTLDTHTQKKQMHDNFILKLISQDRTLLINNQSIYNLTSLQ